MTRTDALAGARSAAGAERGDPAGGTDRELAGRRESGLEGDQLDAGGGTFSALSLACGTLLLGLLSGACRAHVTVCDRDCDEVPVTPAVSNGGAPGTDDGAGGAGREMGGEPASHAAAGAAGATTAECAEDLQCDDGVFCNGAEKCEAGACMRGTKIACDGGTTCVEQEAEAVCEYTEASPWLLLLTSRQVVGLPTAELGKRAPLVLGERSGNDIFVGFNDVAFSPDGRHALIDYALPDFGQQTLELDFGAGVPKPVERVQNLPNWGVYSNPVFSRDGARALLSETGSGTYLLDLTGPAVVPSSLPVPAFLGWNMKFCQANDNWVDSSSSSSTTLYSLASGEPVPTEVDGEVVAVSPDGLRVWLRGENARVVSCDAAVELGPSGLPDAGGSWSPDSRWLLAALDDSSAQLFSVSATLETNEVWSNAALGASVWSSDGRALLVRLDGGAEPKFAYVDLGGDAPVEHALDLAADATLGACGDSGCLVFAPHVADESLDLLWQPLAPHATASVLAAQLSSEAALIWADFGQNRLLLERATASGSQLTLTDFDASPERAVFDWPGGSLDAKASSDGSGLLLQVADDSGYSNFWLALPTAGTSVEAATVPLDVPAYRSAFQPWPRQRP